MKKLFYGRALKLMAMSPLTLLCMSPGLGAQELDLSQEEVAIERVVEKERDPAQSVNELTPKGVILSEAKPEAAELLEPQAPSPQSEREPVDTVNELTPKGVILSEAKPEAGELLKAPLEVPEEEREPVEPVNEIEPAGIVLGEPVIEAPAMSAQELERATAEVLQAPDKEEREDEEPAAFELDLENQGLETQVCEQKQRISDLEGEITSLQNAATDYMPLLNTMNQLMMMNMNMMMMNQNQLSFQSSPLDMMGSMMSPMMMMQSMSMGMSIASMNNLYHQPKTPMPPQYNYNIGGDFYGRDYSMIQGQQPVQAPNATPYGFEFGGRTPSFTAITPARPARPASEPQQLMPQAPARPAPVKTEDGMVD